MILREEDNYGLVICAANGACGWDWMEYLAIQQGKLWQLAPLLRKPLGMQTNKLLGDAWATRLLHPWLLHLLRRRLWTQ